MQIPPWLPRCAPDRPGLDRRDGRRHCGVLDEAGLLWRQWPDGPAPSAALVAAVEDLARLPEHLQARLVRHLVGVFVGAGGVPEVDMQQHMRGRQIAGRPEGHLWDASAGRYDHDQRVIVVGDRPSASAAPALHEVGHALDVFDGLRSSDPEFRRLYERCAVVLAQEAYRAPHELFAEAFALLAVGTPCGRRGLARLLSSDVDVISAVGEYFARRYQIGG